jgi:hypothetical protein
MESVHPLTRTVNISRFVELFAGGRSPASDMFRQANQDAHDAPRTPASVFSAWQDLGASRKRLATSISVVTRSPSLRGAVMVYDKLKETLRDAVRFFKAIPNIPSQKISSLLECFETMIEVSLNLKADLILMELSGVVESKVTLVLNTPLISEETKKGILETLRFEVQSGIPFLEQFRMFSKELNQTEDLVAIEQLIRLFLEQRSSTLVCDVRELLFHLFYNFRKIRRFASKMSVLLESKLLVHSITPVHRRLMHFIAAFRAFQGRSIDSRTFRENLLPIATKFVCMVHDSHNDHAALAFVDFQALGNCVESIVHAFRGLDDILQVMKGINQVIDVHFQGDELRPLVFDFQFVDLPDLEMTFDVFVADDVEPIPSVARLKADLADRDILIDEGVPNILELIRTCAKAGIDIISGSPPANERDIFSMFDHVFKQNLQLEEPDNTTESTLETLHYLHLYFLSLHVSGKASYSNSVLLTYLRCCCLLLFEKDVLNDLTLFGPFPDTLADRILPHWDKLCKSIPLVDTDSLLGDLRLTFVDLCTVIGDEGPEMNTEQRESLLSLFSWFLVHSSELPTLDDLMCALALLSDVSLPSLGSVSALLHEYFTKTKERTIFELPLPFMSAFLGTGTPSYQTNGFQSFLPLFVESASQGLETGELTFDQQALEALRDGSSCVFDGFSSSLIVSHEVPFRVIAMDVQLIGDPRLSSSFQLIFRGGFSPRSVAECLRVVLEGGHRGIWKYIVELSFFLCFVQTRDAIAKDFSMLRQINLRFFGSIGNGYLFLSSVFSGADEAIKRISSGTQRLKRHASQVPLTEKIPASLDAEIFHSYSLIKIGADQLDFLSELVSISAQLEGSEFSDVFEEQIRPPFSALRIPSHLGQFANAIVGQPFAAAVLDSLDSLLQLVILAQQSDAVFAFYVNDGCFLDLIPDPTPLSLLSQPSDLDPLALPYSIISTRYSVFNQRQLRDLADSLQPVPDVEISAPNHLLPPSTQDALLEMLTTLQDEHERFVSAVQPESPSAKLYFELDELKAEIRRFEAEIDTYGKSVRQLYTGFLEDQKRLTEEFSRENAEFQAVIREQILEKSKLETEMEIIDREIAAKLQMRTLKMASNRMLARANEGLRIIIGPIPEVESSESPEPRVISSEAEEVPLIPVVKRPPTPEYCEEREPPPCEYRPGIVPERLRKFVAPWVGLSEEAMAMIERSTAVWEAQCAQSCQSKTPSSECELGFVGDVSCAMLHAQIDDRKRRIAKGTQLLAELLSPN